MINLIKSDLYRLFRSKSYRGCVIGSLAITIFILGIAIFTDVELWLMAFTSKEGLRRGFLIGLDNDISFMKLMINALGSGAAIYIIGITLTSSIIMHKNRSGVMKNTISYGYNRWKIYLSQVITLIIGIAILTAGTFLTILAITTMVYSPKDIGLESIIIVGKTLILYISIVATTVSIYVFFVTLIPNSEIISVIAMAEMLGLAMLGPKLSVEINNWIPYSMIRTLAQIPNSVEMTPYLLSCIVLIATSTYLGILVFNKKEIK